MPGAGISVTATKVSRRQERREGFCLKLLVVLVVLEYEKVPELVCMYGHTSSKSMDHPDKVANPARGQLNRGK